MAYEQFVEFFVSDAAQKFHKAGLDLATDPKVDPTMRDYPAARLLFGLALEILGDAELDDASKKLQAARIQRDSGFTLARQAIAFNSGGMLLSAEQELLDARELTLTSNIWDSDVIPWSGPVAELWAEHHATFSLLARLATVAQVMGVNLEQASADYYHRSHEPLWSNRYYQASNAINGARHETLQQRFAASFRWAGRAAVSVAAAGLDDKRNFGAAFLTVANRLPALRSRKAAEISVLAKP